MATILSLTHVPTLPSHLHPTYGGKSVPTISLRHRVPFRVITTRGELTRFRIYSQVQVEEDLDQGLTDEYSKLRRRFHELLRVRRTPKVPLKTERAKLIPYKKGPGAEIMETCPKRDIPEGSLVEEAFYLHTESCTDQGKVPVLMVSLKQTTKTKRPAIVILHATKMNKEWVYPLLLAYASRDYVTISIDARYHGERSSPQYNDALIQSWKNGRTMPFIFDNVWDLRKLADYLTYKRDDVDPDRIGITGISLGGMNAWFAAFADPRYRVVVPVIGVQGFRWAMDNDQWHGRVDSIRPVFDAARKDLGKSKIDKEVVDKVWERIAPGIASRFDSPYSIPVLAPRPLLILNGEDDPRNPSGSIDGPVAKATEAYKRLDASDKFNMIKEPGVKHILTEKMVRRTSDWFDKFL